MSRHDRFDDVAPYLDDARLAVVATVADGQPYVATVFFCYDEALDLYFLSTPDRRHSREIRNHPRVAVAVADHDVSWADEDKRGLQIEGECRMLDGDAARAAFERYVERFPAAAALAEEFEGEREPSDHAAWRVRPERAKIWDEAAYGYEGRVVEL